MRSGGELAQLADSLARARREYALAVGRGDRAGARTLSVAVQQLEALIANAAQDYHHREGC